MNPCTSNKQLSLPPFGKEIAMLLAYGVKPRNDIFLFAGLYGWQKAEAFQSSQFVMCLPYGKDPANYSWPVKDCPVLLIDTGFLNMLEIERISFCLLSAKAEIVRAILANYRLAVYRRESA